jgi:hypothetical protein
VRCPENSLRWYSENHVVGVEFVVNSRQRGLSHFRRDARFSREQRSQTLNLGLFDILTVIVGALELVFATCVFVYIRRLEDRTPALLGEKVGAHKSVLAKLHKRESLSQDEIEYATELISDARSPLAFSIPAALFTMGLFYVVGCFQQLHGAAPSFRTFIGLIPMLASTNMTVQLLRVAGLKGRLPKASSVTPESSDELSNA